MSSSTNPLGRYKGQEEYPEGIIPSVREDPWGKPYVYLYPGRHGTYDLMTLGRDNAEGGTGVDADTGNWELQ